MAAAVGVLTTFTLLGGSTAWVGYETLSGLSIFEALVGGLLVVLGLVVALGRGPSLSISLPARRSGVLGFGLFGMGYALAGAGCVAPVFLAIVARAATLPTDAAVLVLGAYAGTVAVLMAATTIVTGVGVVDNANRVMSHADRLTRVAGVVMVAAGIGQLYLSLGVY